VGGGRSVRGLGDIGTGVLGLVVGGRGGLGRGGVASTGGGGGVGPPRWNPHLEQKPDLPSKVLIPNFQNERSSP